MESNQIEDAVNTCLERCAVRFTTTGGQKSMRDKWECYAWRVRFTAKAPADYHGSLAHLPHFETDYYCGLAHVKPRTRAQQDKFSWQYREPQPLAPNATSVLSSLLLDARAKDQSFDDWCSDMGYSNDSLKALETYRACCANADELRRIFTREQVAELTALVQDY